MNRVFLPLLSVSLALTSPVLAQEPIPIGVYLPLTGNLGYSGQSIWEGIRIGHKMCPQALDRPVALRIADTRSDRAEATNAVFRLTEKEKVAALIGERTPVRASVGSRQSGRRAIPVVSTSATSPSAFQGKSCVFGARDIDSDQAVLAAKLTLRHFGARTAAIVYDMAQEDSIRLAASFKNEFSRAGGKVLSEMRLKTGDRDFTAQINQIRKTKPGIIYAPVYYVECALMARQARDMALDTPIIACNAAHASELLELGGEAAENIIFTSHFGGDMTSTEIGEKIRRICESETGKQPQEGHYKGAEAYLLILDAIRRCGSVDPAKIHEALTCTTNFEEVYGTIKIDEDGTARSPVFVNQVRHGKFVSVPTEQLWPHTASPLVKGQTAAIDPSGRPFNRGSTLNSAVFRCAWALWCGKACAPVRRLRKNPPLPRRKRNPLAAIPQAGNVLEQTSDNVAPDVPSKGSRRSQESPSCPGSH